ncbi:hypothetical protein [Candidatus Finniella inopinata]|nr:hypothetical protein [Candidatus Finniella inopinata]
MHTDISAWVPMLIAKFCHDLASPLGSLGLGLEMLGEGAPDSDTTQALQKSCETAQLQLKFFRLLFTYKASLSEVQTVLERMAQLKSIRLEWQGVCLDDDRLAPLVLGLFVVASETLIRGGTIKIILGTKISLECHGSTVQWRPDCLDAICSRSVALRSPNIRIIVVSYLHHLSDTFNKTIAYELIDRHRFSISIC